MICTYLCSSMKLALTITFVQVYLWSQKSSVEGAKDCGDGWRVASPPLECSTAVTAVDFAPVQLRDQRYIG